MEFTLGQFPLFTVDLIVNGVTEGADFTFFFSTDPALTTPFVNSGAGEFGDALDSNGTGISVTQGEDFTPIFGQGFLIYNSATGAQPGLNYGRYDVNSNGIYETVVEFDFGVSPDDDQEDRITRIFYDNTDSNLNISTVVPEPTSLALLGLGGLALLRRSQA